MLLKLLSNDGEVCCEFARGIYSGGLYCGNDRYSKHTIIWTLSYTGFSVREFVEQFSLYLTKADMADIARRR